jgi:hypothetical protein
MVASFEYGCKAALIFIVAEFIAVVSAGATFAYGRLAGLDCVMFEWVMFDGIGLEGAPGVGCVLLFEAG